MHGRDQALAMGLGELPAPPLLDLSRRQAWGCILGGGAELRGRPSEEGRILTCERRLPNQLPLKLNQTLEVLVKVPALTFAAECGKPRQRAGQTRRLLVRATICTHVVCSVRRSALGKCSLHVWPLEEL